MPLWSGCLSLWDRNWRHLKRRRERFPFRALPTSSLRILRKIRYREGKPLKQDEYVNGALLGREDEELGHGDAFPEFDIDMVEEDLSTDGGSRVDAVVDDDDKECVCVLA